MILSVLETSAEDLSEQLRANALCVSLTPSTQRLWLRFPRGPDPCYSPPSLRCWLPPISRVGGPSTLAEGETDDPANKQDHRNDPQRVNCESQPRKDECQEQDNQN